MPSALENVISRIVDDGGGDVAGSDSGGAVAGQKLLPARRGRRGVDGRGSRTHDTSADTSGGAASGVGNAGGDVSAGVGARVASRRKLPSRRDGRGLDGRRPSTRDNDGYGRGVNGRGSTRSDAGADFSGGAASGIGDSGGDVSAGVGARIASGRKLPLCCGGRSLDGRRSSGRDDDGGAAPYK